VILACREEMGRSARAAAKRAGVMGRVVEDMAVVLLLGLVSGNVGGAEKDGFCFEEVVCGVVGVALVSF
jgi:hypothetical protein